MMGELLYTLSGARSCAFHLGAVLFAYIRRHPGSIKYHYTSALEESTSKGLGSMLVILALTACDFPLLSFSGK
jgi:hypothetical protein